MTINVVAKITVLPGKAEVFEDTVAAAREEVRRNPACHRYDLQRLRKSDVDYIMLETWESVADLKVHGSSEVFVRFSALLSGLVAGASQVDVYEPIGEQSS